jgi:Tfp pilus assembly protein PilN
MTTAVATPETKPDLDPLRVLHITANLLPAEIIDARRERKLRRIIAACLVVVLALLAVWDIQARRQTSDAQAELNKAQDVVRGLQVQQRTYANLSTTKSQAKAITDELKVLMANDLQWSDLLPALRAAAPAGVTLTSIVGTMTAGAAGAASAATVPGVTSANGVGNISLVGLSPDKLRIASFVDALGHVAGLANPYLTNVVAQSGGLLQFTIQVELTSAVLGGRYSAPTASATTKAGK